MRYDGAVIRRFLSDGDRTASLGQQQRVAIAASSSTSPRADLYGLTRRDRADARTLLSDGRFHPSDAGHAAFAGVLAPLVLRAAGR